ncbi:MAG: hypothetical protein M3220_14040, partial [Chloroflexota bacterium]|nr:hypothetical protein [Chloroflexota bacterium]
EELGLTEDDHVRVVGTLRQFVIVDLEEEFGVELDDELFEEWEDQPVLIADSITPFQEEEAAFGEEEAGLAEEEGLTEEEEDIFAPGFDEEEDLAEDEGLAEEEGAFGETIGVFRILGEETVGLGEDELGTDLGEEEGIVGEDEGALDTGLGEDEDEVIAETDEEALEEAAAIDEPLRDVDEPGAEEAAADIGGEDLGDEDEAAGDELGEDQTEGLQPGFETDAREYFAFVPDFDVNQILDEDGSALVIYENGNIVACGVIREAPAMEAEEEPRTGVEEEVTPLADIAADPEAFEGQEVTVEEEVTQRLGRGGFLIGEGENEVLVLSTTERGFGREQIAPGTRLRVRGEPQTFDPDRFEEEFGITLNRQVAEQFQDRPVITVSPRDIQAVDQEQVGDMTDEGLDTEDEGLDLGDEEELTPEEEGEATDVTEQEDGLD